MLNPQKKCITLSNIDPEIISAFSRIVKDKFGYKVKTKKNNSYGEEYFRKRGFKNRR